jgi:hypothetical protein
MIIIFLSGIKASGQDTITFRNFGKPTILFADAKWYSSNIHEIIVKPDSTFEFWSRPYISCFTWHHYEGTWKKIKDTLFFYDNYQVEEDGVRTTYNNDSRQSFIFKFKTDKNSDLQNKKIKIQYNYDYDAHLNDLEKTFEIKADNTLTIPFSSIPNLNLLAGMRIEYQLNSKETRYSYLTQNNPINKKQGDLPNSIGVEFVENPKKETVWRTTRGLIQNDTLKIISTTKTKTTIPDYYFISFENNYPLSK